jgi:tetratricopeptide (TPR) repeat protein
MKRILWIAASIAALGACGGGTKQASTTPGSGSGSGSATSTASDGGGSGSSTGTPASGGGSDVGQVNVGSPPPDQGPPIVFPNQDPDPAQVRSQVEQHLNVARSALASSTPDPDTALREAREALRLDATNLDAAAMIAFAYYHKKQYDTAELVLDELFKRPAAKENANVLYVYGLVYDKTNRPEQAVLAYQKAVAIKPDFASALVDLGVHQLENKQYPEAQGTFEKLTQMGRTDAVTLTSLASAYRGRSGDYAPGSADRNQYITQAESTYKRALATDSNYGPAYYNLALLYLDSDPFPSGGSTLDPMARLTAAKTYMDQYKNMPGVDIKLYDQREKEIDKATKRAQKAAKRAGKAGKGGAP